jgi:hypothetical protein
VVLNRLAAEAASLSRRRGAAAPDRSASEPALPARVFRAALLWRAPTDDRDQGPVSRLIYSRSDDESRLMGNLGGRDLRAIEAF